MKPIVLAITGASGSLYAIRLLETLLTTKRDIHLVISHAAGEVFRHELGLIIDLNNFSLDQLLLSRDAQSALDDGPDQNALSSIISGTTSGQIHYHNIQDYAAGIASGSFLTDGMVICPCSMGTLSSLANGLSSNLIHRAAHVHLKERRKLIVVPRETPLSGIHLGNMKTLSDEGAVILPAMPGFYHNPVTIHDLVDFVVARICDQLGVEQSLTSRWSEQ
ncbi:MAG: UbiX family flavin prenyltransferase [Planctomycetaceae bacterium]|jgi:flavin prenyltransferase|nr:UbiX family flavin prenyltransferase [Planctomycetaceae bacterium]MDG2389672.1 UbiX family flavin prenyltransferase [Planctomycetaceae bacterium]